MKVKTSVLGHFGEGEYLLNGQTIKTQIITDELQKQLGHNQVLKFDSYGGWKTFLKAPLHVFSALKNSENVLIFPAQNGLRVYAPLLFFQRYIFENRKLHYVVIGGWLPQFLSKRKKLAKILKNFDCIYVETNTMKKALEEQGFSNICVLQNCKNLTILSEDKLIYPDKTPYKLCTFSRVIKEKGIEEAVNVVIAVNKELGYEAFTLDIYGQVDAEQTEWFNNLQQKFPDYINYCGCVNADESVKVLQSYFALIFSTLFYTEGVPGTIIDAYAAGVPVISAEWESFSDMVDEGETGIGYSFNDINRFKEVLLSVANNPKVILNMKVNCIKKAKDYIPEKVIDIIIDNL